MSNPYVAKAIGIAGGASAVAKALDLKTPWAVNKWKQSFPPERALWLAEATEWKVTPHQLAPDLYPNEDDALPAHMRRGARRKTAVN